jgi:protein-L-isoaspartate(D-aspartate) O-methyltransferase
MEKEEAIQYIINQGYLKTPRVIGAFRKVPREKFVLPEHCKFAYADSPLPLIKGQTISQPLIVAYMTEKLDVQDKQKILEIGAGSGYQAALLSVLNPNGKIYSVEIVPELAEYAKEKLCRYKNVKVINADASLGLSQHNPFDRIIATCACRVVPKPWLRQLKDSGKILAPVGGSFFQRLLLFEKKKRKVEEIDLAMPCAFVPLRGELS